MAKILLRHRYSNKEIFQTRRLVFDPYDYNERNVCLVIGLIGVLIEAVKEQQKQIEEFKDLVKNLTTPQ